MRRRAHSLLALAVIVLTVLSAVLPTVAAAATNYPIVNLVLNGRPLVTDVSAQLINNKTMVPVRVIFEGLGATVGWIDATRTATVDLLGHSVAVTIGSSTAIVDGAPVPLDAPPLIIDSRTLVPLRFIAEAIGAKVDWIQETRTATIDFRPVITGLTWVRGAGHGTLRIVATTPVEATVEQTAPGQLRVQVPGAGLQWATPFTAPAADSVITSVTPSVTADGVQFDITLTQPAGARIEAAKTGVNVAIGYQVTGVSVDRVGGDDRVIIHTSGAPVYRMSRLADPGRLVVDLALAGVTAPSTQTVDGTYISQVRLAPVEGTPGAARVVLDYRGAIVPVGVRRTVEGIEITVSPRFTSPLAGTQIIIDPGHGGPGSPGAVGRTGLRESFVNLDISESIRWLLIAAGADVTVTREADVTVDLYDRPALANEFEVDAFVSIHCNSAASRSALGTQVYYYNTSNDSSVLARYIYNGVLQRAARPAKGIYSNEPFVVIRETTMPAVLLESAFISNATEEHLLATFDFRYKLALGVVDGLTAYFGATVSR